jgi:hypothetical protein
MMVLQMLARDPSFYMTIIGRHINVIVFGGGAWHGSSPYAIPSFFELAFYL